MGLYGVDNGLVLERRAVVAEVHGLRLLGELLEPAAGIFIALLEGVKGGDSLTAEPEVGSDCLPVKLESCATLYEMMLACSWKQISVGRGLPVRVLRCVLLGFEKRL